jgi:DNA-binding PadR family transcriptional regulator
MLFDGGNVSFELEDKIKPISADFQRVVQTLIDLDAPQSGNALKKALRQAGLTVKNDDFNPMLERMEREGLIEIDRTSGRGWKITVSDAGRERYEDVDLMTGYRPSELVDEFEQEEHDTVTEDECDTCGYFPCECDA